MEAEHSRVLMNPICVSNQVLQNDSQIHDTPPEMDVDYQESHKQSWRDFFLYIWLRQDMVMDDCLFRQVETNLENRVCNDYFDTIFRIRPYWAESTRSHQNSEVKLLEAQSVLRWETPREYWVSNSFAVSLSPFFSFFYPALFILFDFLPAFAFSLSFFSLTSLRSFLFLFHKTPSPAFYPLQFLILYFSLDLLAWLLGFWFLILCLYVGICI